MDLAIWLRTDSCRKLLLILIQIMDEKGRILIREANRNGGKDNIAIVLIEPFANEVKAC